MYISTVNGARDVTLKHATGNIQCNGTVDIVLDSVSDKALLLWDQIGSYWCASKVGAI